MDKPLQPKPTLRKRVGRVLLSGAAVYVLVCIGVAILQRQFIYFPESIQSATLDQMARREGFDRWKNSAGENIGWKRLSPAQPAIGSVLITHGNAGCAVDRVDYAVPIQQAAALDIFILEYPGYGDRAGSPSQSSLFAAAEEGFQLLSANAPVYLVGESLGTGVAAYLAGTHPEKIAGLALAAPYNRLSDVAQFHMPVFPVCLLLRDRFASEEYLRNYHGPVAVLLSGRDEVIPDQFGRRLADGYAGPKRLWEFPNGSHVTVMQQPPEVWKEIIEFWRTGVPSP